jgi:hypothetical protein
MAHQFRLGLIQEDALEIDEILESLQIVPIRSSMRKLKPARLQTTAIRRMGAEKLLIYLVHEEDIEALVFRKKGDGPEWTIDSRRSPVVEFLRCFFDGKILRTGRLFYDSGYFRPSGAWEEKSEGFRHRAARLFQAMKKRLTYDRQLGVYLGNSAAKLLSEGRGKIVDV